MSNAPAKSPRPGPERFVAWLYTGPLGHLWSAVADLAVFFFRSIYTRARKRLT